MHKNLNDTFKRNSSNNNKVSKHVIYLLNLFNVCCHYASNSSELGMYEYSNQYYVLSEKCFFV